MTDSPWHFTKREMQALVRSRGVWIGMSAAGVILGIAGPFGTIETLRWLPRLVYWVAIAGIGFLGGSLVSTYATSVLRALGIPDWPALGLGGSLAGLVLFGILVALNIAVFGVGVLTVSALIPLGINVIVISVVVTLAYAAIIEHLQGHDTGPAAPSVTRILARVPIEKRGRLLALSVQDHYVEVITDKGSELVLLRLSDAMQEVGDVTGLQVHRSHWVATGAVTSATRDGAKAVLTLSNGRDIPVSRTYVPAIKEAGLLPR